MEVERMRDLELVEKPVKLGSVKPGQVVRFAEISYEEALAHSDGPLFYSVIEVQPKKTDKVTLLMVDCKSPQIERDADRLVVVHRTRLQIGPAQLVLA